MTIDRAVLDKALANAVSGGDAHVATRTVFDALDWQQAGQQPGNAPHSVFQLLRHMLFWQDGVLSWFDGEDPLLPTHASDSWPGEGGPESRQEWDHAVERFRNGLDRLGDLSRGADLLVRDRSKSRLEMLHALATHNSYHAGQVVLLRQMLGAWPPPSGGMTW